MTEAEWRACVDPEPMLRWLGSRASEEQLRKFGIACCRRIWHLLGDERSRRAVEAVERYVQGAVTREQLHSVCDDAEWPYQDANLRAEDPENTNPEQDRLAESAAYAPHMLAWPWFGTDFAVEVAVGAAEAAAGRDLPNAESAAQAELLRSIMSYRGLASGSDNAEQDAAAGGGRDPGSS